MDMPIQIVIVLFVAVAVGGAVIMFTQSSLNNAQQGLADKLKDDPAYKNSIVEVDIATDSTLIALAETCNKRYASSPDPVTCFAVFAKTWDVDFDAVGSTKVATDVTINTEGVQHRGNDIVALKILYQPVGKIVITE